jgi:hypothetical protein
MEQAAQTFNWASLALPALLAFIPIFLLIAGFRMSRHNRLSLTGRSMYWLAAHAVTLVLVTALVMLRGNYLPAGLIAQLPLIFSVLYLFLGIVFRSPFFFSLGLATPGLWLLLVKAWEAFAGAKLDLFLLPQDPFWYLLAGLLIYGLQYLTKPREFWEEAQSALLSISAGYVLGGLWLLALGQASLLSGIGLTQYLWAAVLAAVAAFFLWCGKYLRDPLFIGCSLIGLAAGVYTFISHFPW